VAVGTLGLGVTVGSTVSGGLVGAVDGGDGVPIGDGFGDGVPTGTIEPVIDGAGDGHAMIVPVAAGLPSGPVVALYCTQPDDGTPEQDARGNAEIVTSKMLRRKRLFSLVTVATK